MPQSSGIGCTVWLGERPGLTVLPGVCGSRVDAALSMPRVLFDRETTMRAGSCCGEAQRYTAMTWVVSPPWSTSVVMSWGSNVIR